MSEKIKEISREEAHQIIDTGEPIGRFYEIDGDIHVGIDNSTGDVWVEEFKTKEECIAWLEGRVLINKDEIYIKALETWGIRTQITIMFEEMSELQKALCKSLRCEEVTGNIAEEIADVEIMLEQMKLIYGIDDITRSLKQYKLERLQEKLEDMKVKKDKKMVLDY